jgi:hypothetical protein
MLERHTNTENIRSKTSVKTSRVFLIWRPKILTKFSVEHPKKIEITHRVTPEKHRDKSPLESDNLWNTFTVKLQKISISFTAKAPKKYCDQSNRFVWKISTILQRIIRNLWRHRTAKIPKKEDFHLEIPIIYWSNFQWLVRQNLEKKYWDPKNIDKIHSQTSDKISITVTWEARLNMLDKISRIFTRKPRKFSR